MGVDSRGTTITIRKHLEPEERPTIEQLIEWNMLGRKEADLLSRLIIEEKKNSGFRWPYIGWENHFGPMPFSWLYQKMSESV